MEKQQQITFLPEIYKLIINNASAEAIKRQLFLDFYSPTYDAEKVLLAIQRLKSMGVEGRKSLNTIAEGTDQLGIIIKKVLDDNTKTAEIENFLGIDRFGKILDAGLLKQKGELSKSAYDYARVKGYTTLTYEECMEYERAQFNRDPSAPPRHLEDEVDNEVIIIAATFGMDEPAYFEALGPLDILKLRSLPSPAMLLLGSYGKYSANEFNKFSKKINPQSKSFVIDIDSLAIEKISPKPESELFVTQADARALPFKSDSMDEVYTNRLLRFLGRGEPQEMFPRSLELLLREALRVLKPGGSLVLTEATADAPIEMREQAINNLLKLAERVGFNLANMEASVLGFVARKEVSSTTISSNGFPNYKNSLLVRRIAFIPATLKLTKPI